MKTVLLLATTTGYQIRAFGDAAARAGVRLRFASDRCDQLDDPWWDSAIPVRFHEDARSADAIVAALHGAPLDGILAVGDRPTVLAATVAQRLGLPGHPPSAAAASRNKLAARRAFEAAGLLVPAFRPVSLSAALADPAAGVGYPAVVKPLALSGSRGVMRVNDAAECLAAVERLGRLLRAPDVRVERDSAHGECLVEAFIPGRECAVEGLLTDGALRVLAIFDKPDPLDGPFFEETIYVTPSREEAPVQEAMGQVVAAACRALGLHYGPVHAECRVNERGIYVLEVAARPIGGLCSRALRFDEGQSGAGGRGRHSLEDILLRHATGEDVAGVARESGASAVMMIPIPRRGIYKGVAGVEEATRVPGVEDVRMTTKLDALVLPLPEGHSYLGFIFASAAAPAAAEHAVRAAHAHLRFDIARELPLL